MKNILYMAAGVAIGTVISVGLVFSTIVERSHNPADLPSTRYGMEVYRDELTGCEYLSLPGQHTLIPRAADNTGKQLCTVVLR